MTTHYLPAFVAVHGRFQQAACGAYIRESEHSNEPTCAGCRDYLAECARPVEDLFGEPDPSQIVAPPPDRDVVGDYNARMRRIER